MPMHKSRVFDRAGGLTAAAALVIGACASAATLGEAGASAAAAPRMAQALPVVPRVIATGLAAPRHIELGSDGRLYVALAGSGGSTCVPGATQGNYCIGLTGAVDLVKTDGAITTVLSGLPSVADTTQGAGPPDYLGPAGVYYDNGTLNVVMEDDDLNPDGTNGLGADGTDLGQLVTAVPSSPSWDWKAGPNFAAYAAQNPQGSSSLGSGPASHESPTDSDPYDITPYNGGYAVVDAAANDLLAVSPTGQISTLATLPAEQGGTQAVPTSVTVGPDQALYVGELGGATGPDQGTEVIYRVVPGKAPTVYASGLTTVTALAFDSSGQLLALEYNTSGLTSATGSGALVEISHGAQTTVATGLTDPTGLAVGLHGAVFISNNGDSPTNGQILQIPGNVLSS